MEVDLRMFLEPAVAPLMGVEIVEDDMQLASRKGSHDVLHEAEKLGTTPPLRMCRNDPSGGDFERCKQCRSAVPFVVVALAAQGASIRQPDADAARQSSCDGLLSPVQVPGMRARSSC